MSPNYEQVLKPFGVEMFYLEKIKKILNKDEIVKFEI